MIYKNKTYLNTKELSKELNVSQIFVSNLCRNYHRENSKNLRTIKNIIRMEAGSNKPYGYLIDLETVAFVIKTRKEYLAERAEKLENQIEKLKLEDVLEKITQERRAEGWSEEALERIRI